MEGEELGRHLLLLEDAFTSTEQRVDEHLSLHVLTEELDLTLED